MSALPLIATAKRTPASVHVCFTLESGHVQCTSPCPLWANSGHSVDYPISSSARPTRVLTGVARVLIIGASRGIGLETVKAALEAGHLVRALARSARRIPVDHPKLEKM